MEEKQKILIVEDEESIAELERDYLELSGFLVDTEKDGEKGLQRALTSDYDLLILDIMLPGRDGFSVTQELRAKKDIPILLVSARRDDIDKIRGLGLGADDYMTKPFSASEPCLYQGRAFPGNLEDGIHRRHCDRYRTHQKAS